MIVCSGHTVNNTLINENVLVPKDPVIKDKPIKLYITSLIIRISLIKNRTLFKVKSL